MCSKDCMTYIGTKHLFHCLSDFESPPSQPDSQPASDEPESAYQWRCTFEDESNRWCGIVQDTTDQFDWLLNTGPTPSDLTGPQQAAEGMYYIFIEASNPRRAGDEAV